MQNISPRVIGRLTLTVLGCDLLGVILAVGLSIALHGVFLDPLTCALTIIPMVLLGTGLGVWQAVNALR